jgi:ketosteroid isomerase-like protein
MASKAPATQTTVAAAQPAAQARRSPQPAAQAQPAPQPKPVAGTKPAPAAIAAPGVLEAVNGWAKAWSSKDADAYLSYYAEDFATPKGESRADWEKARRQRIAAPKTIAVTVESPRVAQSSDTQASVTFRQGYRSDALKASATKTLVLVKAEGRWLIQQEKVIR